ncbi:hypothetical protein [Pseudomonas sp. GL-RE-20]|uniref:hypothetical protein n=1 Tax=Pseudomonas sp. GL-RE-20 TaxID=2832372 RepID=UPI001CBCCE7C|nr:hypothetical protein [Pseudomonas sp. GL-RE-20]
MADLWKPVSGVYWRTPPAVPDEGWPLWAVMISALVVAFLAVAVVKRIAQKIKPEGLHLRQHLGEIGGALTLIYLVIVVVVTRGRADTLMTMPLNEVGDFLAGAFGPVAFLWLVFGFLQQGDELRQGTKALELQAFELKNSVEQQSIMAAAATQQIEAQRAALQLQLDEIDRGKRANFMFAGSGRTGDPVPGSLIETSMEISCYGAVAHDVRVVFDPPIGGTASAKFELISGNRQAKVPMKFTNPPEDIAGVVTLSYTDVDGVERQEKFAYTIRVADPWVKIKNRVTT